MKRVEPRSEWDDQFQGLHKKVTLHKKEKATLLYKLNSQITRMENKTKTHQRFTYYAVLTTSFLLLFILLSPSFINYTHGSGVELTGLGVNFSKETAIPFILLLLFSTPGFICFYYAFKPHENDDDSFLDLFGYEMSVTLLFIFILWICKKLFGPSQYVTIFRIIVFLLGLTVFYLIFVFWQSMLK
ncbi:hypothetical protein ACERII_15335 [Evansella sp. AB-rgal1]|uniref:hypothetical protein n=1 Tax=Evansella sp. AB-rgal1 TaxID=3242696 RepID=UPI00359F016D